MVLISYIFFSIQSSKPFDPHPGYQNSAAKLSLQGICRGCSQEQIDAMIISWSLWTKGDANGTGSVLDREVFNIEDWSRVEDLLSMTRAGVDTEFLVLRANSLESGKTYAARVKGRLSLSPHLVGHQTSVHFWFGSDRSVATVLQH